MFKRHPELIFGSVNRFERLFGLETPLAQKRVVDAWDKVVGAVVARYTADKYISKDILHVKITSPAVRSELMMMHTQLTQKLNNHVGSHVINDIRIF